MWRYIPGQSVLEVSKALRSFETGKGYPETQGNIPKERTAQPHHLEKFKIYPYPTLYFPTNANNVKKRRVY